MHMRRRLFNAALVMALSMFDNFSPLCHASVSVQDANDSRAAASAVVQGKPFSAIKYSRKVKVGRDGKKVFLRNESYPVQIARDAKGRIRLQSVTLMPECDRPTSPVPPLCPVWSIIVFDPDTKTITHWPEGERGAKITVELRLTDSQVDIIQRATSVMPYIPVTADDDGGLVTKETLGEQIIDGVRSSGTRTTVVVKSGNTGASATTTRIHEVWTSDEMKLVMKTVDGDPAGIEEMSGLEHVSMGDDESLFKVPADYEIQHPKASVMFVDGDIYELSRWFVGQNKNGGQE